MAAPSSNQSTNAITMWCKPVPYAELPQTNIPVGARAFVTDASIGAGNFGGSFVGGGTNVVPVFWDGVTWRLG
jgi:hypothetical protein